MLQRFLLKGDQQQCVRLFNKLTTRKVTIEGSRCKTIEAKSTNEDSACQIQLQSGLSGLSAASCSSQVLSGDFLCCFGVLGAPWASLGLSGALCGALGLSGALWGSREPHSEISITESPTLNVEHILPAKRPSHRYAAMELASLPYSLQTNTKLTLCKGLGT